MTAAFAVLGWVICFLIVAGASVAFMGAAYLGYLKSWQGALVILGSWGLFTLLVYVAPFKVVFAG